MKRYQRIVSWAIVVLFLVGVICALAFGDALAFPPTPPGGTGSVTGLTNPLAADITAAGHNITGAGNVGATSVSVGATGAGFSSSGVIDGYSKVTVSTSGPVSVSGLSGYYVWAPGVATTAGTFNLPTAAAGEQYCFETGTGVTGVMTIKLPASTYADYHGVNGSATGTITMGGALGDAVCVRGTDGTHYKVMPQFGVPTLN